MTHLEKILRRDFIEQKKERESKEPKTLTREGNSARQQPHGSGSVVGWDRLSTAHEV